jgi:hypothetical protein
MYSASMIKNEHLFLSDADTRTLVIKKLDSCFFQRLLDLGECGGTRADLSAERLHTADCADRDARALRQLDLFPAEQNSCGAQLSSTDHEATVTRRRS